MAETEENFKKEEETWLCKNVSPIQIPADPDESNFGVQCGFPYNMEFSPSTREKIAYDHIRTCMAVEKHRATREMDLEYEDRKNSNRISATLKKEMMSYEVYQDGYGELYYVQVGPHGEKLHTKKLCNLLDYHCSILRTYGKIARKVLKITWRGNEDGVYFQIGKNGISAKNFYSVLRDQGTNFQISRRCAKEVVDSLISYSITNSNEIEIPNRIGWNMMRDKMYHFAKPGEIVMKVVWKNAY